MEFKERLRQAREAKGITQKQLAKRVGVAVSTIQRAEYGPHEPSAVTLAMIAGELDVSLDELFENGTTGEAA